jgi:cytoskeletal protein RodZ
MWAIAVAVADGVITMVVMSLVGLWIWSQLRIWRTREDRNQSQQNVTRAVWP